LDNILKIGLEKLEMIDQSGNSNGLVQVEKPEKLDFSKHSIEEIIAIERAYYYKAHYIYFRRFKNRPPVPQIYIYDYTKNPVSQQDLITLHQKLYSSGHVPMFFVFTKSDIVIFNCYERPAKGSKLVYKPLTTIKLVSEIVDLFQKEDNEDFEKFKAFSGRSFDNGTFWENSPFSKEFQFAKSAYEKLLSELKQALVDIINREILPAHIARKVMVLSILIKYLEERTDELNNSVFPKAGEKRVAIVNGKREKIVFEKNFFDRFSQGATCFTDILKQKGAALKLLDYLAAHFNGGIFELTSQERLALEKIDLTRFALFLEGKLQGVQFVFWRLYSFNDLPIELISNIYEEFLGKKPGVVYTPPYLVTFLLDEAMPLANGEIDFKILDPACGSGVFLVGAYRRLIYRWRKQNGWKQPKLALLKKLLKENIYGSDKDAEAVNLTIFSLSLALCDELTPLEIWENLEFDDLSAANILADDFFILVQTGKFTNKSFHLVIGNPPFEANLTEAANKIETETVRNLDDITNANLKKEQSIKLPDNQIALLFLERCVELCKPGQLTCLIQPSGPLLYNNSSFLFRKFLFNKYNVPQVIDFTHISRVLFGKNGDVATAAVFIKNESPFAKGVLHVTIRRTKTNKEKIYFELDSYDFHYIPRSIALNDPYIWKANFLGGGRVHQLIKRLGILRTIGDFLKSREKNDEWAYSEGYIVAKNEKPVKRLQILAEKRQRTVLNKRETEEFELLHKKYTAKYLTGKKSFNPDDFTSTGISKTFTIKDVFFNSKRDPKIYKGPHLLIKEVIEDDTYVIPVMFTEEDIAFKNSVFGIHGDTTELKKIESFLKNNHLYSFYLAGTSGRFMVNKSSSLLATDIKSLPFPEQKKDLKLNSFEQILVDDFINYTLEFRRNGENSVIALEDASDKDLSRFASTYCTVLNTVYPSVKPIAPFITDSFICFPFYFDDEPQINFDDREKAEEYIGKLVKKVSGVNLRVTRIVRMYEGNVIYLLKPKKLRYWLRSTALRDADETFIDLRKQGF
jgi:type I restriction-modification system DNA methylase subunit